MQTHSMTVQNDVQQAKPTQTHANQAAAQEQQLRVIRPAADVLENDHGFRLAIDLPGVQVKALTVEVDHQGLLVEGKRYLAQPQEEKARPYVLYRRQFTLPDTIDGNALEATLSAGVLTLDLPKRPEAKPRRIQVKAE